MEQLITRWFPETFASPAALARRAYSRQGPAYLRRSLTIGQSRTLWTLQHANLRRRTWEITPSLLALAMVTSRGYTPALLPPLSPVFPNQFAKKIVVSQTQWKQSRDVLTSLRLRGIWQGHPCLCVLFGLWWNIAGLWPCFPRSCNCRITRYYTVGHAPVISRPVILRTWMHVFFF